MFDLGNKSNSLNISPKHLFDLSFKSNMLRADVELVAVQEQAQRLKHMFKQTVLAQEKWLNLLNQPPERFSASQLISWELLVSHMGTLKAVPTCCCSCRCPGAARSFSSPPPLLLGRKVTEGEASPCSSLLGEVDWQEAAGSLICDIKQGISREPCLCQESFESLCCFRDGALQLGLN